MEENDADYNTGERGERSYLEVGSLEEVRSKITINSYQLLELTHHEEKLHDRVHELNLQGVAHLRALNYPQALLFFGECERTLEYAASCGRTIDRALILTVLNNQACAYQRSEEAERAASYVEAIIYNLNIFVDSPENAQLAARLHAPPPDPAAFLLAEHDNLKALILRKYELALYLLQFSGLNSQNQLHEESLKNARRSLTTMRELCRHCHHYQALLSPHPSPANSLIKELSALPEELPPAHAEPLRNELRRLLRGDVDNNQLYHDGCTVEPLQTAVKNLNLAGVFSLEPKQIHEESILETDNLNNYAIELCSNYYSHLRKALYLATAYFAVSVELQELLHVESDLARNYPARVQEKRERDQKRVVGELNHVMALIVGFRYVPFPTALTEYLLELYRENYPNMLDVATPTPPPEPTPMDSKLDRLKEKYKNFIIEREINFEIEDSDEEQVVMEPVIEEKKESRKLNSLFKTDSPPRPHNHYLSDLPSIDSIEMANSVSVKQSFKVEALNPNSTQPRLDFHPKKTRPKLNPKLKSTRHIDCDSELRPQCPPSLRLATKEDPEQTATRQTNPNLSCKKSKSMSKKSKSKGKCESRKNEKKPGIVSTCSSSIPNAGLINTLHERSDRSIKKHSNDRKAMMGSAGPQHVRWMDSKKNMGNSEQMKSVRTQFASQNNGNAIRMNKVKSPLRTLAVSPIPQGKEGRSREARGREGKSRGEREGKESKEKEAREAEKSSRRPGKSKSRGKMSSKGKSLPKKSLAKPIKTSKDKVNPSVYLTRRR